MVTVAIIDDGIGSGLYHTNDIIDSIEITSDLIVRSVDKCNLFNDSHGTICAAILKKYFSKATLTSIKILNDKNHRCKKEQLIKAIEWCMDNSIQVVNMSLGTIDYRDFEVIRNVINRAYNRGLIIVAACNNRDIFTYPASFTNTIGVKCSRARNLKEGEYIFNLYPIDGIELIACSEHKLLQKGCGSKITKRCNSYAAPMITAEVCNIVDNFPNITLEEIKQNLYKDSINYREDTIQVNNYKNIDWISNAALLCMNERQYAFESLYINQIKSFKRIEDIKINEFDTLILSNTIIKDYEKNNSIIHQLQKEQKSLIIIGDRCQDENYEIEYQNNIAKFWHPSIIKHFYKECLPQEELDVPLIIVYDYTDNKMMQVLETLTANFRSDGYYAVSGSTKSIGALYGLEYIPINKYENLKEIKYKIEVLYKVYDYDLMILGLSINKEDINIIKKINKFLNPDKTIFLIDNLLPEINTYVEKVNNNDPLIIISQDDIGKYSYLDCKIFSYKDFDLFYKQLLDMLLYEN